MVGRTVITSLAAAGAVTLLITAALLAASRLNPESQQLHWLQITGSFALAFTALLALQLRSLPGPLRLARKIDTKLALAERLSSAVENRAVGEPGRLSALLEADADRHAESIEPGKLVSLRPGSGAVWLLGLGFTVLLAAWLVPLGPQATMTARQSQSEELDAAQIEYMAEELLQVAATVTETAEARDDGYLAAVANRLQNLSEQLMNDGVSRSDLQRELTEIREHLLLADTDDPNLGALLPELADWPPPPAAETSQEAAAAGPADALETAAPAANPATPPHTQPQEQASAHADNPEGNALQELPDLSSPDTDVRAAPGPDFGQEEQRSSTYADIDPDLMARLDERRQQFLSRQGDSTAAEPTGAAERSPAGAGDLGGDGEAAEAGSLEIAGPDEADFGFSADMQLPFDEDTEGQRVTVEASPDIVVSDAENASLSNSAAWRTADEPALEPERIGLRHQDAVARYFLPPAAND